MIHKMRLKPFLVGFLAGAIFYSWSHKRKGQSLKRDNIFEQ